MFSVRTENQDGRPGLWLAETFFDFSSETAERIFNETWQEARSQQPTTKFLFFFGPIEIKQDGRRGLWLAETF